MYFTPTKRTDDQPLVNLKNNCPGKSIEKGMSCNSVWIPTFVIQIPGQKVLSFCQIYFSRKKVYQNPTVTSLNRTYCE